MRAIRPIITAFEQLALLLGSGKHTLLHIHLQEPYKFRVRVFPQSERCHRSTDANEFLRTTYIRMYNCTGTCKFHSYWCDVLVYEYTRALALREASRVSFPHSALIVGLTIDFSVVGPTWFIASSFHVFTGDFIQQHRWGLNERREGNWNCHMYCTMYTNCIHYVLEHTKYNSTSM